MPVGRIALPVLVVVAVCVATAMAVRSPIAGRTERRPVQSETFEVVDTVRNLNAALEKQQRALGLTSAAPADELTIYRRLSLALHGTVPSLEELRRFESDLQPDRIGRWTATMLDDPRFSDYFAERLARAYVSIEPGQFLIFRRDRFTEWLSQQLQKKTPYDEIVRQMIAGEGVWTGDPEVNFITQGYANDEFDENKLAARTVRAFLGQRIDCAQCHDHPFAEWKQAQFQGLAACFGQVERYPIGLYDDKTKNYEIDDPSNPGEKKAIDESLPFSPEWAPSNGGRRERLAAWVTHPENKRFERALANRVWALMFGKPFVTDRPVDDLPNPDDAATKDQLAVLDILGADFRAHECDLRRMIEVITASAAFRMQSTHPETDPEKLAELERNWAVFPLVRLRPEQVIGAMLQSNSVKTIDQNSHLFSRAFRYLRERDFINEFGDPGDAELQERPSTIPQALLEMNGEFAQDMSNVTPFGTPGRLRQMASNPPQLLDCAFLVCLTRHPTAEEQAKLLPSLEGEKAAPGEAIQDLFWALFNSEEFNWNH
jgi:hypothetical protein